MLKWIESEAEGGRGIKREREGDIEEEKSSETTAEKSSEATEEKSSGAEEEGKGCESEEDEYSVWSEEEGREAEEGEGREAEEEEGEDTCVYSEYEDRSGEPSELDIASEDEGDEYVRAYVLHMWKSEDFDALPGIIKGRYLSVIPKESPYRDAWWDRAKVCAEFAVKHYNKRRAGPDEKLEFVELTNATSYGWIFFNVTFEAANLINGEKKIYQAKVEGDMYDKFKVELFRKKRFI